MRLLLIGSDGAELGYCDSVSWDALRFHVTGSGVAVAVAFLDPEGGIDEIAQFRPVHVTPGETLTLPFTISTV